jgi:hypothetical protein
MSAGGKPSIRVQRPTLSLLGAGSILSAVQRLVKHTGRSSGQRGPAHSPPLRCRQLAAGEREAARVVEYLPSHDRRNETHLSNGVWFDDPLDLESGVACWSSA